MTQPIQMPHFGQVVGPLWASRQEYERTQGPLPVIFSKYKIRTQWELHRVPEQYQFSSPVGRTLNLRLLLTPTPQGVLILPRGFLSTEVLEPVDLGLTPTFSHVSFGQVTFPRASVSSTLSTDDWHVCKIASEKC